MRFISYTNGRMIDICEGVYWVLWQAVYIVCTSMKKIYKLIHELNVPVMITLERRHRTLVGAGQAQGSRQETRGRSMIILTASGRDWRIESFRTLRYGEQGGRQVRLQGSVAAQLRTQ